MEDKDNTVFEGFLFHTKIKQLHEETTKIVYRYCATIMCKDVMLRKENEVVLD